SARLMLLSLVLEVPAEELMGLLDPMSLPEWVPLAELGAGSIDPDLLRREFLRLTGSALMAGLVGVDAERAAAAVRRQQADPELLRQLRYAVRQAAGRYDALP